MSNNPQAVPVAANARQLNRQYMLNTIRKRALCQTASGQGTSQAWVAGSTLNYAVPTALNAFLEAYEVQVSVTVTPVAGTAAVYGLTAAGPMALFDSITVGYNGTHQDFKPYIIPELNRLQGRYEPGMPTVLAGQSVASTQSYLSTTFPVSVAANTWTWKFRVPLNLLHPLDPRGMLPIMGGETPATIAIRCASTVVGNDPANNALYAVSGTGHAATVVGNVSLVAVYRDGESYRGPGTYALDPSALRGTAQIRRDLTLTGLAAGGVYRNRISIADQIYWLIATVIDGNQANKFASNTNIDIIEVVKDEAGASAFWRLGTGSNLSVQNFFWDVRDEIKQDLSEGILPIVRAPTYGLPDPTERTGTHLLNTSVKGWPDARIGVQLTTLGGLAGVTPRIEVHAIYNNRRGLVVT